jgi:hypothetical protein
LPQWQLLALQFSNNNWQWGPKQRDQIGRTFAYWVIVYFGKFYGNSGSSPNSWATFFHGKKYGFVSVKKRVGLLLGNFFTTASGHPGPKTTQISKSLVIGGLRLHGFFLYKECDRVPDRLCIFTKYPQKYQPTDVKNVKTNETMTRKYANTANVCSAELDHPQNWTKLNLVNSCVVRTASPLNCCNCFQFCGKIRRNANTDTRAGRASKQASKQSDDDDDNFFRGKKIVSSILLPSPDQR